MTTPNLLEDLIRMRRRIDALEAAGGTRYGRVTKELDPDRSLFEVMTMDGGFESLLSPVHIYQSSGGAAAASLWASSPILSTGSVNSTQVRNFGAGESWTITADGTDAGLTSGASPEEEELYLPYIPPMAVEGLRVECEVGGSVLSAAYMPWGLGGQAGATFFNRIGALLSASPTDQRIVNLILNPTDETGILTLVIMGWATTLPADTRVLVYPNFDAGGASSASLIGSYVHVLSAVDGRRYHVGIRHTIEAGG